MSDATTEGAGVRSGGHVRLGRRRERVPRASGAVSGRRPVLGFWFLGVHLALGESMVFGMVLDLASLRGRSENRFSSEHWLL